MSKLDQAVTELKRGTPILMYTSEITGDMTSPAWNYLTEEYKTVREPFSRILVTFLNAIMTQQRAYFAITRDRVRQIAQSDPNWRGNQPGFGNDEWPTILRLLADTRIAVLVQKGRGRRPSVYRLGEEWMHLLETTVDSKIQEAAAIAFVERSIEPLSDHNSDLKGKRET